MFSSRNIIMPAKSFAWAAASIASSILMLGSPALGEDGVAADSILFGQAAVLSGPTAALGQGMKEGLNAAFEEINKKGGIHGRKLKLISVDDRYEPEASIVAPRS